MQEHPFRVIQIAGSALLISILPMTVAGQVRPIVSNQLAISQSEAALRLEFADDGTLEIALRNGSVTIDGEEVGSFERGGALDTAWRSLLGEIVSLSDGPLGETLRNWEAPSSLADSESDLAQLLDRALEDALRVDDVAVSADPEPTVVIDATVTDLGLSLQALLSRSDLLGRLSEVLEAVDVMTSTIHIGEDVVVSPDETIEGAVVVIDADVTVAGLIDGDVVVVEGSLEVLEGGQITGEIRLVDSSYDGVDESALDGRLIRIESDDLAIGTLVELEERERLAVRIRAEIQDEIRNEIRRDLRDAGEPTRGFRPWRAVGRGIADVVGDVIAFLLLSLLALGTVYFAKDNLEVVADTAQRNPVRAGVVGLAGAFLVLPTWLLGCVALLASVVGIIALPFWALLFPVAVALGAGLGYLAVARNIGEWVASRNINGLEWIRPTNTFYAVTAGIGALLAFSVSANILNIVPFFGFFSGLLATLGTMATVATLLIGFGAVLLTRGGRQADVYDDDDAFGDGGWRDGRESEEVMEAEELPDEPTGKGARESSGSATAGGTGRSAAERESTATGTKTGKKDDA